MPFTERAYFPAGAAATGAGPFPAFQFRGRHEGPDWRRLSAVDVGRVWREGDVAALQEHLEHVTFLQRRAGALPPLPGARRPAAAQAAAPGPAVHRVPAALAGIPERPAWQPGRGSACGPGPARPPGRGGGPAHPGGQGAERGVPAQEEDDQHPADDAGGPSQLPSVSVL